MVRNNPNINKYNIYTEGNYNRYVYMGNTRIGREEMNIEDGQEFIVSMMVALNMFVTMIPTGSNLN